MDRTTVLHKLESSEQHRLEMNRIRSRGFLYMLLIPAWELVFLTELIARKVRSLVDR